MPQKILAAIAVMHIEINNRQPRQPVMIQRALGGNGDGAKQTKAHRGFGFRVMPRRAGGNKGVARCACNHRIHRRTSATHRPKGGIKRSGRQLGIAINLRKTTGGGCRAQAVEIGLRMAAQHFGIGGKWGVFEP